ncbi:glycoside hydrolase family 6 protein [Streptomyces sp. NPDC058867]|uniref:glycoside hydrolase family 6 protein n=1 Tax=unclassified Streptomyces TaxID=2593676 RepID=UPI0036A7126C
MRTTLPRGALTGILTVAATASLLLPMNAAAAPVPTAEPHQDNPFTGASAYLNPDYAELVDTTIARTADATLRDRMAAVKHRPTAVWLDRIAAVHGGGVNNGRKGLREHLDAARAQQIPGRPITATFVIYNLPGRDCAALASNGELPLTQAGLERYRRDYIDEIANVMADPAYADIRIVTVIEPDGLPNLVTNLQDPECSRARSSGIQVEAVRYALDRLHALPNVYTYLDIAHSGWLGWDTNLRGTVDLYTEVANGTRAGLDSVDGFATNVANYTPATEPFLPDPERRLSVSGLPLKSSRFYEWNPVFDEADYAAALWTAFRAKGWPATTGMIMDTSRNGWGGAARPTGGSASLDVDTHVQQSAVDRRAHRGLWCNVAGAGLGRAPQASPRDLPDAHLDAYVWVKPPGESDGASEDIPNGEGKRADPMCDPGHVAPNAGGRPTGALPDAPLAGHWFHEQFTMLVRNSRPAVPASPDGSDNQAPEVPRHVRGTLARSTSVTLAWDAAEDDGVVAGYDVFRGGRKVNTALVEGTVFTDSGLRPDTGYTYTVRARDEAGNVSGPSDPFTVTTQPSGPASGGLRITHRDNDGARGNNAVRPGLRVVNTSSQAVALRDVKVRYWFTRDGDSPVSVWCDHAALGCSTVSARVVELRTPVQGADAYVEIGFRTGTLPARTDTGDIELRLGKADWSDFDESDDHSHSPAAAPTDAPRITAYLDGNRAWGDEPS